MADDSEALQRAWGQQRVWSQTANRLKNEITRARSVALCLAITTAILAVAAVQVAGLASLAGRILAAAGAITAGVGTIVQRRVGTDQTRAWTRARSVSEGVKSEVYQRLAVGSRTAPCRGGQKRYSMGLVTSSATLSVSQSRLSPCPTSTTWTPTSPIG